MAYIIPNPYEQIFYRLEEIEASQRRLEKLLQHKSESKNNLATEPDFTRKQASANLQISLKTLNILLRTGQLSYYNIGRSVRIPLSAIEAYKKSQKGAC